MFVFLAFAYTPEGLCFGFIPAELTPGFSVGITIVLWCLRVYYPGGRASRWVVPPRRIRGKSPQRCRCARGSVPARSRAPLSS